jgi:hypothetical protein
MIKQYSIADTFGINAPASMKVEGFEPAQNPYVPICIPQGSFAGCIGVLRLAQW